MLPNQNRFNVLVAEQDTALAHTIVLYLTSEFGLSCYEAQDLPSAEYFFKTVSDLHLVILGDLGNGPPPATQTFLNLLLNETDPTPHLVLFPSLKVRDPQLLLDPCVLGSLPRTDGAHLGMEIAKLVKNRFFQGELVEVPAGSKEFLPFRTRLIFSGHQFSGDVFVRLTDTKYLRAFKKFDPYDADEFDRYWKDRHLSVIYVRNQDAAVFLPNLETRTKKAIEAISQSAELDTLAIGLHETLREIVQDYIGHPAIPILTRAISEICIKSLESTNSVSEIIERGKLHLHQYIAAHSVATAEVACLFASKLSWLSDMTLQKLSTAAIFHDILLRSNALAQVKDAEEPKKNKELLLLDTFEEFQAHPTRAADLVNLLPDRHPDIALMVQHHHERVDGKGFPAGLSPQLIPPLSCLFIMAHDFVDTALSRQRVNLQDFFAPYRKPGRLGPFKDIARALLPKLGEKGENA